MKKLYFLLFTFLISAASFGQTTVFVNELHYDNSSTDIDEGVEIAGPSGTDLTGWTLVKYNGNGGGVYGTETLSGTIPDQQNGYGTLGFIFASNALQNGAPDGFALVDNMNNVIQFLSYEGVITATDGVANGLTSIDIGVSENSSPVGESLQLTGTGDTYEEFSWAPSTTTASFGSINSSQSFTATNSTTITITSPIDASTFVPGTSSVDIDYTVVNAPGTASVQVTVNMGAPVTTTDNPYSIATSDGVDYTVLIEVVDGGVLDSDEVTFSVGSITQVANIAALRAATEGEFYELTGEVLLTFQQSFRNQKFIEDATAGILIDDSSGNIITPYNIADGISGIIGELSSFDGMMQFVPSEDPGTASSTGNTLTPQMVSLADLSANSENYESELVMVTAVTMDNTTANFSGGSTHEMTQATDTFNFRSSFFDADYVDQGAAVPTDPTDITGIITERSGNAYFLTARNAADFSADVLSNESFEAKTFSLYPNPTSTGKVSISSKNSGVMDVAVYDILGKQVKQETVTNTLDVSNLRSGVYILKITQNEATSTKKLVIK